MPDNSKTTNNPLNPVSPQVVPPVTDTTASQTSFASAEDFGTTSQSTTTPATSTPPTNANSQATAFSDPANPTVLNSTTVPSVGGNMSGSDSDTPSDSVVTSAHVPEKYGGKKIIATIFSVLFIVGAVVAGVTLVQRNQELREQAAETDHKMEICHIPPGNTENPQIIEVDKNSWKEGHNPHNSHNMDFVVCEDTSDDEDTSVFANCGQSSECTLPTTPVVTATPIPSVSVTVSATNTPTPPVTTVTTGTATPQPSGNPQISAQCNSVVAYDENGNKLSSGDLSSLAVGSKINFAVSGTTNLGSFSKARFTVNNVPIGETTTKNSNGEFYIQYTIPQNTNSFSVKGEILHSSLGWI